MSYQRSDKAKTIKIFLITICSLFVIFFLERSKQVTKDLIINYKLAAVSQMQKAIDAIKAERLENGIEINSGDDPNETGIIGADYTDLTTSLGDLSAKRTASNPNFGGVVVDMLFEAGVKIGDEVAINFSGSFPSLNIAVLSAVQSMDLKPMIISSVGASMYGANLPELTWLDMERILRDRRIFPYKSIAAALGGIMETKGGIDGTGIKVAKKAIKRNQIPFLEEKGQKSLESDIERRLSIFHRNLLGSKLAAFINSGGATVAFGNIPQASGLSSGLLKAVPITTNPQRGLIFRMAEKGVPVIHLLNVKALARDYGLPVDPFPLPRVPSGKIMKPQQYSRVMALSGLCFLSIMLVAVGIFEGKKFPLVAHYSSRKTTKQPTFNKIMRFFKV
jgi:poly-gamma-glutamate system protein